MSKILVTGAAGFVGSHTVDVFISAGHQIVAVDNLRTGSTQNLAAGLESPHLKFYNADVSEEGVLGTIAATERPDVIIHLAALVSVQESLANPVLNYSYNLHATHLVAEAARVHGIGRVVFASSAAVYGDRVAPPVGEKCETRPISPYGAAKLASENLLLGYAAAYGFVVRCNRYFNVYGPRQSASSPYSGVISVFLRQHKEGGGLTIFGDGSQTRDFISVHDVARANYIAATRVDLASGVTNICTGVGTTLMDLARMFTQPNSIATGIRVEPARKNEIKHSVGDPSLARETLGFSSQVDVSSGIRELLLSRTTEWPN